MGGWVSGALVIDYRKSIRYYFWAIWLVLSMLKRKCSSLVM